jgi:hypothetical protein
MRPADMNAMRRRLAEMGIEIAADADYMEVAYDHDLSKPHHVMELDRAAFSMPTYPVLGFVSCLVCGELLFVSPCALRAMALHHVLPHCRSCTPAEIGMVPYDPHQARLEQLATSLDRPEFGNRRPSAEYIRDLLRGGE